MPNAIAAMTVAPVCPTLTSADTPSARRARRPLNRCPRLAARAAPFRHADDVGRLDDRDAQFLPVGMRGQRAFEVRRWSDEQDLRVEVTRGGHGAVNDHGRCVVTPHGVDRDAHLVPILRRRV
jgi:hypothetical protein